MPGFFISPNKVGQTVHVMTILHQPTQILFLAYCSPKKPMYNLHLFGRVAEWFNAPVLKTGVGASLPRVQIPALPPYLSAEDETKGAAQAPFVFPAL